MSLYGGMVIPIRLPFWRKLGNCIKSNFVKSNLAFYSFVFVDLVLVMVYLLVQLPHQTIFHLMTTFLNVLVVALVFLAILCPWNSGVLWFILPKYLETILIRFYEPTPVQVFTRVCTPCRSWLLPITLALFCRNWNVAFLYQWYVGTYLWKYPWKLATKIEWNSWLHSLLQFIVWLWSWSLPVCDYAIVCWLGLTWEKALGCRTCDHSDSEWGQGVIWVNPTCSVFGWKSAHRRNLQVFQSQHADYFYWQLERKTSPYISVSLYENIDDLYVRMILWLEWLLFFRTEEIRQKNAVEKNSCGILSQQPIVFAIPVSDPVSDKKDLGVIISPIPRCFTWRYWQYSGSYLAVTVTSPFETEMFHIGRKVSAEQEDWFCRCHLSPIYQVQVAVPKNLFLQNFDEVLLLLLDKYPLYHHFVRDHELVFKLPKAGRRSSRFDRGDCSKRKKAFESIHSEKKTRVASHCRKQPMICWIAWKKIIRYLLKRRTKNEPRLSCA